MLLLGRTTWQLFSHIWPGRTDDFSTAMNRIPKLVASRGAPDLHDWENSTLITESLAETVATQTTEHDVVVVGSASVVHTLAAQNLVDEYRILVFPELVGDGTKLFTSETVPAHLHPISAETVGPAVLIRYERAAV